MEKSQQLTPDQSLGLINEMISTAKRTFTNNSFYFLLWGVLLFLAGISEYTLRYIIEYEQFFIGWGIAGVTGGIISGIYGALQSKKNATVTYTDRLINYVWGGFIITLILTLFLTLKQGYSPNSAVMVLTGLPTFVTGGAMRFKPLIVGGMLFWIIGAISLFISQYDALLFSLAILVGYIIPGLMLRKAER